MITRKSYSFATLAFVVICLGSVASTRASTFTINTTPHNTTISTFGYTNTATYGQVITAVAGTTQLDAFSFGIATSSTITYRAFVMAWDGTKATGPILFMSADQSTSGTGMNFYNYNTGGLNLNAGQQYVLFANVSFNYVVGNGSGVMAARSDNPYAGGRFVYMNNGGNFGDLSSNTWTTFGDAYDLAFRADFSTPNAVVETPEPASMILLGSGLLGLGGAVRRRRAQSRKDSGSRPVEANELFIVREGRTR